MNTRQMQQRMVLQDFDVLDEAGIQHQIAVENNQDVTKLESDVAAMHDVSLQLAQLVESQGLKIDNIESNMDAALENTEEGTERLARLDYQERCVIL